MSEASVTGTAGGAESESGRRVELDADCRIDQTRPLEKVLSRRLVGQDEAVQKLVCAYSRLLADLHDPSRPLLTALLLGPTGVGKTETARALAQTLFGSEHAMTRVNCEEYAEGHELSKLLGSPPGYAGGDIEPILSQRNLDAPHRRARGTAASEESASTRFGSVTPGVGPVDESYDPEPERSLPDSLRSDRDRVLADEIFGQGAGEFVSVVLFDEIEKAHPKLWNALLGVLEDGTLTLGDNRTTDFSRSIVLLTSNVGSREMSELLEGRSLGFTAGGPDREPEPGDESVEETARRAAREVFPFEFLNRLDEVMVYRPLSREDLRPIFDKFLGDIQHRLLTRGRTPVLIDVGDEAKELIIERGTDLRFGARPLRRTMDRELVDPLSRLIASEKLEPGDVVEVEVGEDGGLRYYRAPRGAEGIVA